MAPHRHPDWKRRQRGVTLLLVAMTMFVVLAMAALAIDLSVLYVARSEAQRAADAAAMAAAKAFALTGVTSDVSGGTLQTAAVNLANRQITAALQVNKIAGQAAQLAPVTAPATNPNFDFGTVGNPRVTVTVQQTGLATFFARIWRGTISSVSATATAEAFNASGHSADPPVSARCVKPLIVPNLDPLNVGMLIDQTSGDIVHRGPYPGGIVGETITFNAKGCTGGCTLSAAAGMMDFVPAVLTPSTNLSCPSCGGGGSDFENNLACCNTTAMACNSATQVALGGTAVAADLVTSVGGGSGPLKTGMQCLIHQSGQDSLDPNTLQITAGVSSPLIGTVKAGDSITTSDSIITLIIIDGATIPSTGVVTVLGYMQLFVLSETGGSGKFDGVMLNIAGCGNTAGTNPIVGGGISPIPVRLIHQ